MKISRAIAFSVCLAAIPVSMTAFAGTAAAPEAAVPSHPTRGMTMAQVLKRFGQPEKKMAPAPRTAQGPLKPPIVRWVYADYIVYFERNRVIHTVLTHPREAPVPHTSNGPGH